MFLVVFLLGLYSVSLCGFISPQSVVGGLQVWSVESGQRLVTLRNHTDGVTCLQFNDAMVVSGSYDQTVKLWDFSSVFLTTVSEECPIREVTSKLSAAVVWQLAHYREASP
ncbi:hypothetical protein LAZ67_14000405, partial [Cordylochernes scorpioides]